MKIELKFVEEGKEYFLMSSDAIDRCCTSILTERGLYEKDAMQGLIAAGYKYLDYHGNIITPEGINIKNMAESIYTADKITMTLAVAWEDNSLSEEEASVYFSRDFETQEIQLKEPKVEIKTREELIEYLNMYIRCKRLRMPLEDVRPLNSFVAKEALFTLEEIVSNSINRVYMDIIEERRKLSSYGAYQKLVKFLQSEGVLKEKYNKDDFVEAYTAWGFCGIKTPIVKKHTRYNVCSSILDTYEYGENINKDKKKRVELCLLDKQGKIHYSGGVVDLSDFEDFEALSVAPVKENEYFNALNSKGRWNTEYKVIRCFIVDEKTRFYMTMIDTTGVRYTARIDSNNMVISDPRSNILIQDFIGIKSIDGRLISVENAINVDKFDITELIYSKMREYIRKRTIKAPVNNSFEMCMKEGVSPVSAISYLGTQVTNEKELNEMIGSDIDYTDAGLMYLNGLDEDIIKRYNPKDIEYETIEELTDIMCNTREEMIADGTYLIVGKNDFGKEADAVRKDIMIRPVENLEFVRDALYEDLTIDNFGNGKIRDCGDNLSVLTQLTQTLLQKIIEDQGDSYLTPQKAAQLLINIEETNYINFQEVIPMRDAAYFGYLKDRATLNRKRALESNFVVYITRVFRESANIPVDQQRHYVFQCISLDKTKKNSPAAITHMRITEDVESAINNRENIDYTIRRFLIIEAPSIALNLMYAILFKKVNVAGEKDGEVAIEMDVPIGNDVITIVIKIKLRDYQFSANPMNYKRNLYCTLYDWCYEEFVCGKWRMYCINAEINPWMVKPKGNFKIPVYNFALNYILNDTLQSLSPAFVERVKKEKAKVAEFCETFSTSGLLESGDNCDEVLDILKGNSANVDTCIENSVLIETLEDYYNRFAFHNKEASADGKYLKRMRLKTDVGFKNFAALFNPNPIEDDEYESLVEVKQKNLWLTQNTPELIGTENANTNMIENKGNRLSVFHYDLMDFTKTLNWNELRRGEFKQYGICFIVGTRFKCVTQKGEVERDLSMISKEDADAFVDKGVFYRLGAREYLIKTATEDYVLEVRV